MSSLENRITDLVIEYKVAFQVDEDYVDEHFTDFCQAIEAYIAEQIKTELIGLKLPKRDRWEAGNVAAGEFDHGWNQARLAVNKQIQDRLDHLSKKDGDRG